MTRYACKILGGIMMMAVLCAMPGCGYTLRGKVVSGATGGITQVHQIDPSLRGPGVPDAEILIRRDPKSPNPQLVGHTRTDGNGDFSIHIGQFGAGWMQEQWLVQCVKQGFQNTEVLTELPSQDKWQLLITIAPGTSTAPQSDFEQFK